MLTFFKVQSFTSPGVPSVFLINPETVERLRCKACRLSDDYEDDVGLGRDLIAVNLRKNRRLYFAVRVLLRRVEGVVYICLVYCAVSGGIISKSLSR